MAAYPKSPGYDLTGTGFGDAKMRDWILDKINFRRAGNVTDIVGAGIVFSSVASTPLKETGLWVDGGWTANA